MTISVTSESVTVFVKSRSWLTFTHSSTSLSFTIMIGSVRSRVWIPKSTGWITQVTFAGRNLFCFRKMSWTSYQNPEQLACLPAFQVPSDVLLQQEQVKKEPVQNNFPVHPCISQNLVLNWQMGNSLECAWPLAFWNHQQLDSVCASTFTYLNTAMKFLFLLNPDAPSSSAPANVEAGKQNQMGPVSSEL